MRISSYSFPGMLIESFTVMFLQQDLRLSSVLCNNDTFVKPGMPINDKAVITDAKSLHLISQTTKTVAKYLDLELSLVSTLI